MEDMIQIEKLFMTLIINHEELLNITQLEPQFLPTKAYGKIYKIIKEYYKKHREINLPEIVEQYGGFDTATYIDLMTNVMYHPRNLENQLQSAEESIFKNFKKEFIKKQNDLLLNNEITYDEFYKRLKKVERIQLNRVIPTLTIEEMEENMVEKVRIELPRLTKLSNTLEMVYNDFLIIGATTGAGKSGLMLNLFDELMDDYQVIYFNLEMSKSTLYKRMVAIRADVPMWALENPTEYQERLIAQAKQEITSNDVIVEHLATDIEQIRSLIARVKNKDKHTIVFIDHLGLVKSKISKNLYEQATDVAKTLRQINLEFDCTIIGASQLNRSAYQSENLTLSMLKDSGELENSASKVLLMQKQTNPSETLTELEIEVAKNRDGRVGIIVFEYNKEKQIFTEK